MTFNEKRARLSATVLFGFTSMVALETLAVDATKPVFMSAEWAALACDAWNRDPVLTGKLVESEWVDNDGKRGFKVMQIYRSDCCDRPAGGNAHRQKRRQGAVHLRRQG